MPSAAARVLGEDELIALDDASLAYHANELAIQMPTDELTSAVGALLDELLERFVPDAQWEAWRRIFAEHDEPDRVAANLEGLRDSMGRREAKRLVRRALAA